MATQSDSLRELLAQHVGIAVPEPLRALCEGLEQLWRRTDEERERLEAQLGSAGAEQLALLQALPDLVLRIGPDDRIVECKPGAGPELALPAAALLGQRLGDLPVVELGPELTAALEATRRSGAPASIEYSVALTDREVFFEARLLAPRAGEVVVLVRDITDRRETEQALRRSEGDYRGLFERAHDAILIIEPEGEIVLEANQRACDLYGFSRDEFVGLSLESISEDVPEGHARMRDVLATGVLPRFETAQYSKQARRMLFEVNASLVEYRGRPAVLSINRDISEARGTQRELEQSLALLRATLESTADGIVVVDQRGRVVTHNRRFAEMWGIPAELLERGDDDELLAHAVEQLSRPDAFLARVRELYGQPDAESRDVLHFIDGRVFERYSLPQRLDQRAIGRVWSFRDVTRQKEAEETIRHQAYHDELTGLPNRLLFRDHFDLALAHAERHGGGLAMLFVDLDRFKNINDTLGHAAGDVLLQEVGRRLLTRRRGEDTIARPGGDEFMVLMSDLHRPEDAARLAESFLSALDRPFEIEGHEIHVSASIGVSLYPDDGRDADTLVKNADTALYRVKERGGAGYQIYTPAMNARALERLLMEGGLRHGLERDELRLHYQPQIAASDGHMVGVEALVRWQHPDGRLLMPDEFIGLAEDTGLVTSLGFWVLRSACQQLRRWQDEGRNDMRVAVNVSPRQFQSAHFLTDVEEALDSSGVRAGTLELELTERAFMRAPEAVLSNLACLRDLGVEIAIDDFGTGYSSLSHLKQLPVTSLKIDQAFVRDSDTSGTDAAIVEGVIKLGHSLGLRIVAEGVESEEQAQRLRSGGCDVLQGFLLARPSPPHLVDWARFPARAAPPVV